MTQQPEALRLAEKIEVEYFLTLKEWRDAAAELRRLHAMNKQLLEALEAAVAYFDAPGEGCFLDASLAKARAAIAAAKGKA